MYIDLGFYNELAERFGAKGDFAEAYVIAHEIGHHVQKQLGLSAQVDRASKSARLGPSGLSVRLELQADCFAGIWARSTNQRNLLDPGDVQEALGAAAAVGDDHIQKETSGTVHPETWTHGSARLGRAGFRTASTAVPCKPAIPSKPRSFSDASVRAPAAQALDALRATVSG